MCIIHDKNKILNLIIKDVLYLYTQLSLIIKLYYLKTEKQNIILNV